MILTKFEKGLMTSYKVGRGYELEKISTSEANVIDSYCLSFPSDEAFEKLKLLIILSPIFLAAFDNGDYELQYLKTSIENSSFPYGLYPNFFDGFDKDKYFDYYRNKDEKNISEDIILKQDLTIEFCFNPLPNSYLKSLLAMVDSLIEDDKNRKILLEYFNKMRDDIVRNGRRSIIANGIQAFYLNKYVVVWMLDLASFIRTKRPDASSYLDPIMDLINELKTPANLK